MNRTINMMGAVLLSVAAGLALRLAQAEPLSPGLYPDASVLEFGEVAQGDVLDGQFRISNRFLGPVSLGQVLTGCSCQKAELSARTVGPGESVTVDVKWSVGTRRGRLADDIRLMYQSPDIGQKYLDLRLTATVVPDIHYTPDGLTFDPSTPSVAVLKFTPGRREGFRLLGASANQRAFTATLNAEAREVSSRSTRPAGSMSGRPRCCPSAPTARGSRPSRSRCGWPARSRPGTVFVRSPRCPPFHTFQERVMRRFMDRRMVGVVVVFALLAAVNVFAPGVLANPVPCYHAIQNVPCPSLTASDTCQTQYNNARDGGVVGSNEEVCGGFGEHLRQSGHYGAGACFVPAPGVETGYSCQPKTAGTPPVVQRTVCGTISHCF